MNRLQLIEKILMCEDCDLCTVGNGPVPFSGPSPARFAILGEAPGREEDLKGEPFTGPSGRLLRSALEAAGLDAAQAFIFNTASCFPAGTPRPSQLLACRSNFTDQLGLSGTCPVLVLGTTALAAFRTDLRITKARGHVFTREGRPLVVAVHPAYVLRSQTERKPVFMADIARFAAVVADPERWSALMLDQCVGCAKAEDDMVAEHIDDDGLLFCEECWPRSPGARADANGGDGARWPEATKVVAQPTPPPTPLKKTVLAEAVALTMEVFPGAEVVAR